MLIGRLCHTSIDFSIVGFGSSSWLGVDSLINEAKTQFGYRCLKLRFCRIVKIAEISLYTLLLQKTNSANSMSYPIQILGE